MKVLNLKYYTTKTPWLRLASSVDLTGNEGDNSVLNKLASLGISRDIIKNTNLAKKLILQGGALTLEETEDDQGKIISSKVKLNKGLNYSNEIFDVRLGKRSLRTYRKGMPIPFMKLSLKLKKVDDEIY